MNEKHKYRVYLAGPITGTTYQGANDWRIWAMGELEQAGIVGVNPLRAKEYLESYGILEAQYIDIHPFSTNKGITSRDRFDVIRCDLMLAYFPKDPNRRVSIGTCIEFGWADLNRTPVICAMEEGNIHEHGMLLEIMGWRCHTLEEAVAYAKAILH